MSGNFGLLREKWQRRCWTVLGSRQEAPPAPLSATSRSISVWALFDSLGVQMLCSRNNKALRNFGFGRSRQTKALKTRLGFVNFLETHKGGEVYGGNVYRFGFIAQFLEFERGSGLTFRDSLWRYFL